MNNNSNNNDTFILENEYLNIEYDLENNISNNYDINEINSPMEKFQSLNTLFNIEYNNYNNNFRKSKSYPNCYYQSNLNEYKYNSDIELVKTSFNPLVDNNKYTLEIDHSTNEESNLIVESNNIHINNKLNKNNYFFKIYYWFELDKISVKTEFLNKFISIILHTFLMVIFEIYFYFNYVIEIEKDLFMDKIQQYINELKNNLDLDYTEKILIKQILFSKYDDNLLQRLYILYQKSIQEQNKLLYHLLTKSCMIAGFIGLGLFILIFIGLWNKYKIKWKWIFVENLIMFILLGLFEYWFFINIILNYNPITDSEIKYFVAEKLINYFNSTI